MVTATPRHGRTRAVRYLRYLRIGGDEPQRPTAGVGGWWLVAGGMVPSRRFWAVQRTAAWLQLSRGVLVALERRPPVCRSLDNSAPCGCILVRRGGLASNRYMSVQGIIPSGCPLSPSVCLSPVLIHRLVPRLDYSQLWRSVKHPTTHSPGLRQSVRPPQGRGGQSKVCTYKMHRLLPEYRSSS